MSSRAAQLLLRRLPSAAQRGAPGEVESWQGVSAGGCTWERLPSRHSPGSVPGSKWRVGSGSRGNKTDLFIFPIIPPTCQPGRVTQGLPARGSANTTMGHRRPFASPQSTPLQDRAECFPELDTQRAASLPTVSAAMGTTDKSIAALPTRGSSFQRVDRAWQPLTLPAVLLASHWGSHLPPLPAHPAPEGETPHLALLCPQ